MPTEASRAGSPARRAIPADRPTICAPGRRLGRLDETALHARLATHADLGLPSSMAGMIPRRGEDAGSSEKKEFNRRMRRLALSLAGRPVVRAVHAERPLEEVMVDFWFNHFNVFARKSAIAMVLNDYRDVAGEVLQSYLGRALEGSVFHAHRAKPLGILRA